jgi:hypothetical protein
LKGEEGCKDDGMGGAGRSWALCPARAGRRPTLVLMHK